MKTKNGQLFYRYSLYLFCKAKCLAERNQADEEQLERLREKITDFTSVSKEHIGLHNVAHRFWLLFKDRQRIELNSSFGAGTEIQIIFQAKSIDR